MQHDLTEEIGALIRKEVEAYNNQRQDTQEAFYIMFPNERTLYYSLWFYSPTAENHPYIYLSNLELNAIGSVKKAIQMITNSRCRLRLAERIDSNMNNGDDIFTFGKYRGRHLYAVCMIDPRYVQWVANKYEAHVRGEHRFKELAITYSKAYFELMSRRKPASPAVSRFIGNPGDKLTNLTLTVLKIKMEDDAYRTKTVYNTTYYYVDMLVTAKDEDENLFFFKIKAKDRSLTSGQPAPDMPAYRVGNVITLSSAKVLKHFESARAKFTKIGYIK